MQNKGFIIGTGAYLAQELTNRGQRALILRIISIDSKVFLLFNRLMPKVSVHASLHPCSLYPSFFFYWLFAIKNSWSFARSPGKQVYS